MTDNTNKIDKHVEELTDFKNTTLENSQILLSLEYKEKLIAGYPLMDIDAQIKRMEKWICKNHARPKDIKTFISNWLNKPRIPYRYQESYLVYHGGVLSDQVKKELRDYGYTKT